MVNNKYNIVILRFTLLYLSLFLLDPNNNISNYKVIKIYILPI